jgi:hypothetical protein
VAICINKVTAFAQPSKHLTLADQDSKLGKAYGLEQTIQLQFVALK